MVSIAHARRDLGRLTDISKVLVRHGFGEVVARLGLTFSRKSSERGSDGPDEPAKTPAGSVATRLRRVLEELGPSFVKLGQIISTRSDLLPPDVLIELKKLLDSVQPVSFQDIANRVEDSLGASLAELFVSFDERPLAAASVAQVHRAQLQTSDGLKEVVVKVQRPDIAEIIARDLDLLHMFAALLERTIPETRAYNPTGLVQHFDRAVQAELDFTLEADNADRFTRNFVGVQGARFPLVYREVSSKHVLTLEFLDGVKIYQAIEQGYDARFLTRLAMRIIIKQVFEDGFFHADPHPGNVLVMGTIADPEYALIDLGLVGRLSSRMRDLTVDLMVAAARNDYDAVADALYSICNPTQKIDMRAYRAEIGLLAERYLGRPLKEVELSRVTQSLVTTAHRFGLEVPPDFLLVGKSLLTLEGIGREIVPDFNILEESRPLFSDLLRKRYSPERLGSELLRRVERLSGATSKLPEQVQEILEDLRLGRLAVRISDTEIRDSADRLGRRLFSAVVASSCLVTGAGLLVMGKDRMGTTLMLVALLVIVIHWLIDGYRSFTRR
jgi:ubiquinone biosynthesis protein